MANDIQLLSEAELRTLVRLDLECVDIVERAFTALADGGVVMPPVMSMEFPEWNAEVDAKTAYIPGFSSFALKVATGFYDNPKLGLPTLSGLMILFSAKTGVPEALLLDNGYLTNIRTAAAGAVAARHLAPEVDIAGVIGTGLQARMQIEAAHLVRPFRQVLVWGRNAQNAAACAADIAASLSIDARPVADAERLVAESQLVVTTTPARNPVLQASWLHPGLHITAIGSDMEEKQEIEAEALAQADIYVADSIPQCAERGELRAAREAGLLTDTDLPELGGIIRDPSRGRTSPDQITVCDLTGTGAQDTVIANHAMALAKASGKGAIFTS